MIMTTFCTCIESGLFVLKGGMLMHDHQKELHVVSTNQQSAERLIQTIVSIHPYVDAIHIREKRWTARKISKIVKYLYQKNVPREKIIINDRVDVATALRTGGAHLATHSLDVSLVKEAFPTLKVGCSVHAVKEAINAQEKGADYCIYGHIFPTTSKPNLSPRGLEQLHSLIEAVNIPVIAIGGITADNVSTVLQTGAHGVAVMSGVFLSDDPKEAIFNIRKSMKGQR